MKDFRVSPQPCPACGYRIDACTNLDHDTAPTEGDPTVCIDCATVLVFAAHHALRIATPADLDQLSEDNRQQLSKVVTGIILLRARRHAAN
jgi:hypothetical protein